MIFHIIVIIILLALFIYISYRSYEDFNVQYKQSNYTPNTNIPVPVALDNTTTYLSPDNNGRCPEGYDRDTRDTNSLCHSPCKGNAKFYNVDGYVYGCVVLDTSYNQQKNAPFALAKDKKTNIVSPRPNGACPKNFKLDTKSGLCYTECLDNTYKFYGDLGCIVLNKDYPQSQYGGNETPYPLTEDGNNLIVSPTSTGECPDGFKLELGSGLCHTPCDKGSFVGTKTAAGIKGCV